MKLNKILFLLTAMTIFIACKEEEGTIPGNDSMPNVTLFQLKADSEGENPDSDLKLRVATNNQVSELYYLLELETEKAAKVKEMGEQGYADYVIEKGKKVSEAGSATITDILIKDAFGQVEATFVAVGNNQKTMNSIPFFGIKWIKMGEGILLSQLIGQTKFDAYQADGINLYKAANAYEDGYELVFKVNEKNEVEVEKQAIMGEVQPGYGTTMAEGIGIKQDNVIVVQLHVTCQLGSFGDNIEQFVFPE